MIKRREVCQEIRLWAASLVACIICNILANRSSPSSDLLLVQCWPVSIDLVFRIWATHCRQTHLGYKRTVGGLGVLSAPYGPGESVLLVSGLYLMCYIWPSLLLSKADSRWPIAAASFWVNDSRPWCGLCKCVLYHFHANHTHRPLISIQQLLLKK